MCQSLCSGQVGVVEDSSSGYLSRPNGTCGPHRKRNARSPWKTLKICSGVQLAGLTRGLRIAAFASLKRWRGSILKVCFCMGAVHGDFSRVVRRPASSQYKRRLHGIQSYLALRTRSGSYHEGEGVVQDGLRVHVLARQIGDSFAGDGDSEHGRVVTLCKSLSFLPSVEPYA